MGVSDETPDARNRSGPLFRTLCCCYETAGQSAAITSLIVVDQDCDAQEEALRKAGVTDIICVRQEQEAKFIRENMPQSFTYHTLDIADSACENIIRFFTPVSPHHAGYCGLTSCRSAD